MKENQQINYESNVEITKKKKSSLKSSHDQQIEEFEKELAKKEGVIDLLEEKLEDKEEMLLNVISDKKILDKRISDLELKELSLKFGRYEELKMEHSKQGHRLQITKKQLDEARYKIESQEKYVADAKKQLEFMEKVINDLEKRGLADFLRSRYPESFLKYQKK